MSNVRDSHVHTNFVIFYFIFSKSFNSIYESIARNLIFFSFEKLSACRYFSTFSIGIVILVEQLVRVVGVRGNNVLFQYFYFRSTLSSYVHRGDARAACNRCR